MEIQNKKSDAAYSIFDIFRYSKLGIRYFNKRGFTIVETLVAIAILLLALTAPLTIAEKGLASAEAARLEITAFYLAQEAIEYVRNVRDTNALAGYGGTRDWLTGDEDVSLLDKCFAPEGCGIDPTALIEQQTVDCSTLAEGCTLYQFTGVGGSANNSHCVPAQVEGLTESRKGLFGHRSTTGWEKTCFTRQVFLEEIEDDIEASVTVRVTWKAGSLGDRSITITEHLFNWYESP